MLVLLGGALFHGLYWLLKAALPALLLRAVAKVPGREGVARSLDSDGDACSVQHTSLYTEAQVAEVAKYTVSGVVGLLTAGAAVVVMWQAKEDFLHGKSWFLAPYFHFLVWYFVYDTYAMFECVCLRHKHLPSSSNAVRLFLSKKGAMCFHHAAIVLLYYPICVNSSLRGDLGDFFIGTLLLRDLSNPLFSITSVLRLFGMEECLLYRVVGVLFVLVFFAVRILSTPFCLVLFAAQHHGWDMWAALGAMRPYCHLGLAAEFSLQMFWFSKALRVLLQGARDVLTQHKHR